MKNFAKATCVLSLLFLAACSDSSASAPTQAEQDMAEMMGITVEELRNQTPEEHMKMMQQMNNTADDHHTGETNVAPHGHDDDAMQQMMDDHHEGETNVMPHGHDSEGNSMMDDHHAGEENVEPHEHPEEEQNLPPSRSRLEQGDDHHAGEENVEPHGH